MLAEQTPENGLIARVFQANTHEDLGAAQVEPYLRMLGPVDYSTGTQKFFLPKRREQDWAVVGFEKADEVLRDRDRYRSSRYIDQQPSKKRTGTLREFSDNMLIFLDADAHLELRKLTLPGFRNLEVKKLRGMIETTAEEVLSTLPCDGSALDLDHSYFRPLTISIMGKMMGVPPEKRDQYAEWSLKAFQGIDYSGRREVLRDGETASKRIIDELHNFLFSVGDAGESSHFADSTKDLLQSGMDRRKICMAFAFLYVAGHSTSSSVMASAVRSIIDDKILRQRVLSNDLDWGSFVGEVTRMHPPAQAIQRTVADVEKIGVPIERGAHVVVSMGAACRDPARFKDPETFNPDRFVGEPTFTFPFSVGVHRCVGVYLAPLVIQIGVQQLFAEFPNLRWQGVKRPEYAKLLSVLDYESFPAVL